MWERKSLYPGPEAGQGERGATRSHPTSLRGPQLGVPVHRPEEGTAKGVQGAQGVATHSPGTGREVPAAGGQGGGRDTGSGPRTCCAPQGAARLPSQLLPPKWGLEVTREVLSPPREGAPGSATAQPWEEAGHLKGAGPLVPHTHHRDRTGAGHPGQREKAPLPGSGNPVAAGSGSASPLPPTLPAAAASAPPGAGGRGLWLPEPIGANQMFPLPPSELENTHCNSALRASGWFRPWQSDSSSFSDSGCLVQRGSQWDTELSEPVAGLADQTAMRCTLPGPQDGDTRDHGQSRRQPGCLSLARARCVAGGDELGPRTHRLTVAVAPKGPPPGP